MKEKVRKFIERYVEYNKDRFESVMAILGMEELEIALKKNFKIDFKIEDWHVKESNEQLENCQEEISTISFKILFKGEEILFEKTTKKYIKCTAKHIKNLKDINFIINEKRRNNSRRKEIKSQTTSW